ncbi:hypothetical protein C8Q77DRAFT_1072154 [Trametes polyzona]|nr:hypothetical protein C8Q77DRAFT_1072154 [Trametes polyzona]
MASLFAHNRILPNLKRRTRSTNKSESSPSKGKPLHILPNLAEEDEQSSRPSCSSVSSVPSSSHPSRFAAGCATVGARPTTDQVLHIKRDSRRVVLTGVEGLTFDDFFPPSSAPRVRTPSPPPAKRIPSPPPRSAAASPASDSPLDDINLRFSGLGISLDFPPPPSAGIRTPSRSVSRRREQSPTPSNASSDVSSSYSSPKTPCTTPPTSDDESPCKSHLARAPTFKSQRASVMFMKSMPDLSEPVRKSSFCSIADDDSILEELEMIAREVSEVVTLSTPLPPTFPTTPVEASMDVRPRPDSVLPLPRKQAGADKSRSGKPLPIVPRIAIQESSAQGPSAQLDPTFPLRRRSYMVPSRPPPPPPVPKSPTTAMEQATEELLAELANAALGAGFFGTELTVPQDGFLSAESMPPTPSSQFIVTTPSALRPPPRFAVPADINDMADESPVELTVSPDLTSHMWPSTPQSVSVYSQMTDNSPPTSPLSSFDFEVDVSQVLSHREEASAALENTNMRRSPSNISLVPSERPLRSRWSSSTLGSLVEGQAHSATSWLPRFTLSPTKKAKSKPAQTSSHSPSPLQRKNAVKSGHGAKRSVDSDRGLTRRDSRASRMSESSASDSGESTTSSGLKRKPIPMALLAHAA